ncbi:MAG TPA: hypothetical protein VFK37_00425, partial [Bacillales bacterium]|nr:hypothetical protein [Bacillales bacterium]
MEGEILKDLSTSHSFNQVHLFQAKPHGKIVRKQYGSLSAFKRAVEAFKFVDRSLHPSIYKIDMKHSTIYMSYDPVEQQPKSTDECIANLLKKLHSSTLKYSGVWDPGTGQRYANWKEFLQLKGEKAVQTLGELADYSVYYEKWINAVEESAYSPVSYIHCSISPEHIGQRKGDYILLDFEHAILGDPYWDVA